MKIVRLFFFFIMAVVATVAILSFIQSTYQKVERSITIQAPASSIYAELTRLKNLESVFVWNQQDSSAVYTLNGTDGTVGASSSWKGSPEISGEGSITITGLEPNQRISHAVNVSSPRKMNADSEFALQQTDPNQTRVTWTFKLHTPRPSNIFNLFYSLDKSKGKDFEAGLLVLKTLMEAKR